MTWQTWLLFVATEAVLCLTPGPAVLLVLSRTLTHGFRKSIWSICGILAANASYFLLSATSLGAILVASYGLFSAIRWAGAAYLVYLGLRAFFSNAPALASARATSSGGTGWRIFQNGFVLQAANPKALVFFTALLPQFINPARPAVPQIVILAASSIAVESFVLLGYGILAGRASHLARQPRFARATNRVAGGLLIGAGVGLAALRRAR